MLKLEKLRLNDKMVEIQNIEMMVLYYNGIQNKKISDVQ